MEQTATATQIIEEVDSFLDYINALADAETLMITRGASLRPKYIIDEAQLPAKEITDGIVYRVSVAPSSTYRKPLLGRNQSTPKTTDYIAVRTRTTNSENEKAPYLHPFWVVVQEGEELGNNVDDIFGIRTERSLERFNNITTEVLQIREDDTQTTPTSNKEIIEYFAPQSEYTRLPWIPTKRFSFPANVMFAYKRDLEKSETDRIPQVWFLQDFKTNTILAAGLTSETVLIPDFKPGIVTPPKVFATYEQATENWNKNIDEIANGYFDDREISLEATKSFYTGLGAIVPPEYFAWCLRFYADFVEYLSRQPLKDVNAN